MNRPVMLELDELIDSHVAEEGCPAWWRCLLCHAVGHLRSGEDLMQAGERHLESEHQAVRLRAEEGCVR